MREITDHRNDSHDHHDRIKINVAEGGNTYFVARATPDVSLLATIPFQSKPVNAPEDINGVTNEVLLAVVKDRLKGFQEGPLGCEENARSIGFINSALEQLCKRTARRKAESTEGKMEEKKPEPAAKPRVRQEAYKLIIGDKQIDVDDLAHWGSWDQVTAAVRAVVMPRGTPLTPGEMAVIEGLATTPGGRNGLAEFKQALAQGGIL